MNRTSCLRPLAGLACAALAAGLALPPGHATAAASAPAALPAEDCAATFPQAELAVDDPVHGLTVSKGTTPEPFTGTVLGVLDDGIAPGTDMILMDLHSTAIDAAGGIWSGMSGSPVYAEDGRLIGAVSYGLAYGGSSIAGVTPFAAMRKYLPGGAAPAAAAAPRKNAAIDQQALARRVAGAAGVTAAQAEQGMQRLPMPMSIAGVGAARVQDARESDRSYLRRGFATARVGRSATEAAAPPETLGAGGNVGAAISYGDITLAGVGTVTSVCDGSLVAFGHPMESVGRTSLTMMTADAITVQPDPIGVPFKVANLGQAAGTIDQDRLPAIAGPLVDLPTSSTVRSTVRYAGTSRVGQTAFSIPAYAATVGFYQVTANADAVLEAYQPGSAVMTYTVKGTGPTGAAYTISFTDRYVSSLDISYDAAWDVSDLVSGLSSLEGVTVKGVTTDAAYADNARTRRINAVYQKRDGAWRRVNGSHPAVIKAGNPLRLRITASSADGTLASLRRDVWVPVRYAGGSGTVELTGGGDAYTDLFSFPDLATAKKRVAGMARNDEVRVDSVLRRKGVAPRKMQVDLGPLGRVVHGSARVPVRIK